MKLTRRTILASSAVAMFMGTRVAAQAPSAFDAALSGALGNTGVPALGGLVVGADGVIWTGATGLRHTGGDPVLTTDLWHLGSNTKAMTAALYGRLVDQGRASWEVTLSILLPGMTMDPAWRDVPLTQVMSHRAGLTDAGTMGREWLMSARSDPRSLPEQRRALVEAMLATPPAGTPGTFAYANANYVLMGAIIERITGTAWEEAMRAEVFGPLGITTGGFGAPTGDQPWGHSSGQGIDPAGTITDNPAALGPAGTAHMSLDDYARFLRVFLTDGAGWVSPETLAALTRPVSGAGLPYAGGWMVPPDQPWANGPCLTHDGSNTMWYASTWVAPAIGRAFVAVANDAQRGAPACRALVPGLIQAI